MADLAAPAATTAPADPPSAGAAIARQSALGATTSVLATLVAGWLGTSPTAKLVAAALAAIIPIVVTAPGAGRRWRALLAVAATAIALFFTYGGFTLFDYAADRPATFPLPPAAPEPGPGGGDDDEGGGDAAQLLVTPEQLQCDADGCASLVTVANVGGAPLGIGAIDIVDQVGGTFDRNDRCASRTLAAGESCRFSVSYVPPASGAAGHARLVVAQDAGDAASVALDADEIAVATDLVADGATASCASAPDDGTLTVSFELAPAELPAPVRIVASSDTGLLGEAVAEAGGAATVTLSASPDELAAVGAVTVAVDADDVVDEPDEGNNTFITPC